MLISEEETRWPFCRRRLVVDAEGGLDFGMLLAHGDGCWDRGTEIQVVTEGGTLQGVAQAKDELVSVDGVSVANYAHAGHLLKKPGKHRCVLLRALTPQQQRRDKWMARLLLTLLAVTMALYFDLPEDVAERELLAKGTKPEQISLKLRSFKTQTLPVAQALEQLLFYCMLNLCGPQCFRLAVSLSFLELLVYPHKFWSHLRRQGTSTEPDRARREASVPGPS